jgi:hypothetical protein
MPAIALPGLVDPHDLSADRQFSMNLARGLEVLRAFTPAEPMLGNREISDRTGLPKPTVSRLTYTLTLLGYLSRDAGLQKYRLGSGVLSLGHPLLANLHVRQVARPLMEQLARTTGCTVNLGMRDRANVVYVDTVRGDPANHYLPDIGSTRPLLAASIGRALILDCALAERTAILNWLKVHDRALFDTHKASWDRAFAIRVVTGKRACMRSLCQCGFRRAKCRWRWDAHSLRLACPKTRWSVKSRPSCRTLFVSSIGYSIPAKPEKTNR